MTRTGKTPILTVAAPGAGDHVKGANPTHDHDNAETDASAAELIKAHEAKYHGAVVEPPADAKPTITSAGVSEASQTSVRVSWQLSEPATGQVEYGKTSGYGSLSTLETNLLASHSQVLSGLTADTTYHFRVHSKDAGGQEVTSSDASFKTAPSTVVTPPPVDPNVPIPAGAVFVATTGSDSGDGTQLSPWATLGKAIGNGRKIVMRGGSYGAGNYNRYVTGTSDVSIQGYPGEKVTIDGGADGVSINDRHFIIGSGAGCRNWLFQDLTLVRFCKMQNGIITISGQSGAPAANWRILRCDITKVAPGGPSFQVIYGGAYMDGLHVEDSIIRGPYANGKEDGAGVGTDHSPAMTDLQVLRTKFINLHKGVQTYAGDSGDGPNGVIDNNRFDGCGRNIELKYHKAFRVTNNSGTVAKDGGAGANLYIQFPALVVASGNVWG